MVCFLTGLDDLKAELDANIDDCKLSELCYQKDEIVTLKFYKNAHCLDVFAKQFDIMTNRNRTSLFIRPLEKKLRKLINSSLESESMIKISELFPLVWELTFKDCQQLLFTLADHSIKLAHCDQHLKEFNENLETQLDLLFKGLHECEPLPIEYPTIQASIVQVRNYWKICEYRQGADIFLKLRDVLELEKGDFTDVEKFGTEVSVSSFVR